MERQAVSGVRLWAFASKEPMWKPVSHVVVFDTVMPLDSSLGHTITQSRSDDSRSSCRWFTAIAWAFQILQHAASSMNQIAHGHNAAYSLPLVYFIGFFRPVVI
jgi:hypothetical protein